MKSITLNQLRQHLDSLLEVSLIPDSCPNGLQVEGSSEIRKIATGVTASLTTIQTAIQEQADALIVHHGLFWNGDSYPLIGSKREKIALLLKHNISLLAYHLPLDLHRQYGNNWRAAQEMGWTNLQPFGMHRGMAIGVKGTISSMPRNEFQTLIERYYQHQAITALGGAETISSVALVSGGAYKHITEAALAGVDCFITGNFDEPAWHQAFEEKINFYALGHSATERIGPMALATHLEETLKVPSSFIDIPNPF